MTISVSVVRHRGLKQIKQMINNSFDVCINYVDVISGLICWCVILIKMAGQLV